MWLHLLSARTQVESHMALAYFLLTVVNIHACTYIGMHPSMHTYVEYESRGRFVRAEEEGAVGHMRQEGR